MSSLFSYGDIKNTPRRSGFDLSNKCAFTAKVGELLPTYWKFCLPGDKFNISQEWFARTQPVDTSAFTRIREYYEWFFVPLHLLYRNSNEAIMSMENQPNYAASGSASISFNRNLPWVDLATINTAIGNVQSSSSPNNFFGVPRSEGFKKLVSYLGYGETSPEKYVDNLRCSAFPLYAYQKIYQDYYRHSQWEKSKPWTYNCDFWNGEDSTPVVSSLELFNQNPNDSVFELRYANWNKDLWMGSLPNSQFGDVAAVPVGFDTSSAKVTISGEARVRGMLPVVNAQENGTLIENQVAIRGRVEGAPSNGQTVTVYPNSTSDSARPYLFAQATDKSPISAVSDPASISGSSLTGALAGQINAQFSVLQLRSAEALQKWKEIAQANGQNYAAQVKAHFGVSTNPIQSHRSTRVCGFDGSIDISAVENTNLTSDEAIIRGKGLGGQRINDPSNFTCTEHGIIMCIYHATPLLDYVPTGPDLQLMSTVKGESWPVPEFDSLGMESLPMLSLVNSKAIGDVVARSYAGYVPRYISWKTSIDVVRGAFTDTLKSWVAPVDSDYMHVFFGDVVPEEGSPILSYTWFKVNPSVLNPIFGVSVDGSWNTDQLLCNCQFNVKVARNLSYDGMPY
nr:MAG TPA: Major capsid protein [Microviridae sp.]